MCGRFYLFSTGAAVADLFDLAGPVAVVPRYNIAPSQPVAVVRLGEHGRELVPLRLGLDSQLGEGRQVWPDQRPRGDGRR